MTQLLQDFDLAALSTPYDSQNFTDIDTWPLVIDAPAYEETYGIVSSYRQRNDSLVDVDVTESFAFFGTDIVAILVAFIATIYYITWKGRKIMNCWSKSDHCLWDTISCLLSNCSFREFKTKSLNFLMICYVMLVFYVIQYYCGYFRTDLVDPRPPFKIDSLDELVVDSHQKLPVMAKADTSVNYFERGRTETHAILWQRHLRNFRLRNKTDNMVVIGDATAFSQIISLVT